MFSKINFKSVIAVTTLIVRENSMNNNVGERHNIVKQRKSIDGLASDAGKESYLCI